METLCEYRVSHRILAFSLVYFKVGPKTLYYKGILPKMARRNSPFLYFFLMHIHIFMLCRDFEWIPIKIEFFMNF